MLKSIAVFSALCIGVAASSSVCAKTPLKNDQYLVSRSKDTYVFVDKGVMVSGAADAQQPKPTTGGAVYMISKTADGVTANRLILLAQCSIPYGITLGSQEVLNKNGLPVKITEFSTKYDSSPVWQVSPSSRFGKVWSVMCDNAWAKHQHWGELSGGELIERVSRRLGESRYIEATTSNLSFDITTQKTNHMNNVLPETQTKDIP